MVESVLKEADFSRIGTRHALGPGMLTIRHILCPVDFSEPSLRALREAVSLAKAQHADVKALHVLPAHLPPLSGLAMAAAGFLEPDARERQRADFLERLRAFVASAADGVPVEPVVEEGDVVNEIVTQATARGVDLVVMGTHGQRGFESLTLGSTTEKTLRKSRCPVLTIPPAQKPGGSGGSFRSILCAVDFSASASRALEYALALARQGEGRLILVHVLESVPLAAPVPALAAFDAPTYRRALEDDARERLRELPAAAGRWQKVEDIRTGKAHDEILRAAEEHGADLIAMGVHGHGALERALFGSTAYHVARRAACPVLTARSSEPGAA